jgi:type VI protein secretion system component VasK
MFSQFLNTRAPSLICMVAFSACSFMLCVELMEVRDTAQVTQELVRSLIVWGTLALIWMLGFCLCLARVTRYRRNLPHKRRQVTWSRSL